MVVSALRASPDDLVSMAKRAGRPPYYRQTRSVQVPPTTIPGAATPAGGAFQSLCAPARHEQWNRLPSAGFLPGR